MLLSSNCIATFGDSLACGFKLVFFTTKRCIGYTKTWSDMLKCKRHESFYTQTSLLIENFCFSYNTVMISFIFIINMRALCVFVCVSKCVTCNAIHFMFRAYSYIFNWREFPFWLDVSENWILLFNFPQLFVAGKIFHRLVSDSLLVKSCFSSMPHVILIFHFVGPAHIGMTIDMSLS